MEEVCFCCGSAERGEALLAYAAGSRIHIEWGLENQPGKAGVVTVEAGPLRRASALRDSAVRCRLPRAGQRAGPAGCVSTLGVGGSCPNHGGIQCS